MKIQKRILTNIPNIQNIAKFVGGLYFSNEVRMILSFSFKKKVLW